MNQYRLAILDDYQGVAEDFAPWSSLTQRGVAVTVFGAQFWLGGRNRGGPRGL
jgi:hypothetical protein